MVKVFATRLDEVFKGSAARSKDPSCKLARKLLGAGIPLSLPDWKVKRGF